MELRDKLPQRVKDTLINEIRNKVKSHPSTTLQVVWEVIVTNKEFVDQFVMIFWDRKSKKQGDEKND